MKKLILTIALILAIKTITFAQTNFDFEVKITGKGSCSEEVWNEMGSLSILKIKSLKF